MGKKNINILLKFGKKEHLDELVNNGIIFCNTLNTFRVTKKKDFRHDPYEGASRLDQVNNFIIDIENSKIVSPKAQVYTYDDINKGNVFCLYLIEGKGIKNEKIPFGVNPDIFNDDNNEVDSCAVIYNARQFIEKTEAALTSRKLSFESGYVEYYNNSLYYGNLSPFRKSDKHEGEKEFRFWIHNLNNTPIKLNIGAISDFAKVIPKERVQFLSYEEKTI